MKCKKCNKEHDGTYGSGKFCSRQCANSRIRTKQIKEKVSKTLKIYYKNNIHHMKGKPGHKHTQETKDKLSKLNKGKLKGKPFWFGEKRKYKLEKCNAKHIDVDIIRAVV